MSGAKAPIDTSRRLNVVIFGFTFGAAVLLGQFFRYQIKDHELLKQTAMAQYTWNKEVPSKRGNILDRGGHLLALDVVEWDVSASPPLVVGAKELAVALGELLGQPSEEILAKLISKQEWIPLASDVEYQIGESILELEASGITCTPSYHRFYPEGELFAHVLGIVNDTGDGFYGVDGYYNQLLRGSEGKRLVEQNPVGEEIPLPSQEELPPQPGNNLVLTLDRNIQYIAREELLRALEEYGAESGTVLIMDPHTGALLAAYSYPSYDPNDFARADLSLLADPAVSKLYEPGSIFKVITWAAALDSGTVSPGTTFYDNGALEVGGRVIRNWDRQGHGLVTMEDGLVQSLNTVAAFASTSMGKEVFYNYLRRFGFGALTQADLASEGPGMVKLPGDSNWFPSELGTNSFGQGIAVTPMQMIVAVAAVANDGMLMKPYVVQQFIARDPESGGLRTIQVEPMVVRRAISQETARTMTDLLVQVIERGATQAQIPGYRVAGKTGTAQIPTAYGYDPTDTIGSFVGWVPADDPQFVVLVKLDRPTASPWGSQTAAPTFRAIAEQVLAYLQIPPDEIRLAAQQ
jgi:cell division protein FtsI (penicillin-binding protein 3)